MWNSYDARSDRRLRRGSRPRDARLPGCLRELQRMMDMLNADRVGSMRGAKFFPMVTGRKASQAADPSPFYFGIWQGCSAKYVA
jgi:hypothetical protein